MRVRVFVVVTARELAQFPIKSFSAGVFLAGFAPAVPAPVPERFNNGFKEGLFREDASAFAHSDVVCRVKADRRQIAEGTNFSAAICRTHGVTTILNKPEIMPSYEIRYRVEVEGIAKRVCDYDGPCALRPGPFQLADVDVVGGNLNVHENGNKAILDYGIDGGGKTRRDGNHFIAWLELAIAEFGRCERRDCKQVRRRTRIDQRSVT